MTEHALAYRRRMGWSFPWVSAAESDFNLDFSVFTDEGRSTGTGFNVRTPKHAEQIDVRARGAPRLERLRPRSGAVWHTYSCDDRGTDALNATWQLLDRVPGGRPDDLEGWPQRHDEYE